MLSVQLKFNTIIIQSSLTLRFDLNDFPQNDYDNHFVIIQYRTFQRLNYISLKCSCFLAYKLCGRLAFHFFRHQHRCSINNDWYLDWYRLQQIFDPNAIASILVVTLEVNYWYPFVIEASLSWVKRRNFGLWNKVTPGYSPLGSEWFARK